MNESISVSYRTGSENTLDPSWIMKNVVIPDAKLYYILEGEIEVKTENDVMVATAGDMMLIPAHLPHSMQLTKLGYARKYWIHFDMKKAERDFFDEYPLPLKISLGIRDDISRLFKNLFSIKHSELLKDEIQKAAIVMQLVSIYLGESKTYPSKHENDEIDDAVDYIKKNYAESISLSFLAKKAGFSPNYFIKKFKLRTGFTPTRYLTRVRIDTAKFLLQNTDLSVTEIMESVGFYDASYFSKLFKKAYGYSPRSFNALNKTNNDNLKYD